MRLLRIFLIASSLVIFPLSIYVIITMGINWSSVYISDMLKLDWHAQFDTDLLIYFLVTSIWMVWREGFTPKGFLFGFLNMSLGSLFGLPYLLVTTYQTQGNLKTLLLGVHSD